MLHFSLTKFFNISRCVSYSFLQRYIFHVLCCRLHVNGKNICDVDSFNWRTFITTESYQKSLNRPTLSCPPCLLATAFMTTMSTLKPGGRPPKNTSLIELFDQKVDPLEQPALQLHSPGHLATDIRQPPHPQRWQHQNRVPHGLRSRSWTECPADRGTGEWE